MPHPAAVRFVITTSVRRWPDALRTAATVLGTHGDCDVRIAVVDDRYHRCRSRFSGIDVRAVVERHGGVGEFDRLAALHTAERLVDLLRPTVARAAVADPDPDPDPGADADPDADTDADTPGTRPVVVISLPDDAEVTGPLEGFATAATGGVALSTVRRTPVPRDGRLPDEVDLAATGLTDHEVFALSARGLTVIDWWEAQVRRHPLVEPSRFATDEVRWLDQAGRLFPGLVTEVAGLTRSYRNADESDPGSAPVLRLVDFDPAQPWNVSPRAGRWPRVTISAHSDLADSARRRAAALSAAGTSTRTAGEVEPYGHLASGYPYDDVMRCVYAAALHHAERNALVLPPNPFAAPDDFIAWLQEDVGHGVNRYLDGVRHLHADVARSLGHDDGALLEWARTSGPRRGFSPSLTGVLPSPAKRPGTADAAGAGPARGSPMTPGVNLIGLFKAEMGVGEAARLTRHAVEGSKIAYSLVLDDGTAHRQDDPFEIGPWSGFRHDVNIVVANADSLGSVVSRLDRPHRAGRSVFADFPTIGLWFWETATFPDRYRDAFRFVDEVWVASRHVLAAIGPVAAREGVPVHLFPLGAGSPPARMPRPASEELCAGLGIPAGRFCFLFAFDHRSVAERKNPWGLMEAFRSAFPESTPHGPVLAIKSISGEVDLLARERLRWMAAGRDDIVLVEGFVDVATRHALLSRSDAYISLHRAEGWGLTMAEAMSLGVPTIATNYSGNLEFMNVRNSWLVDYELVPIPDDVAHYGGIGCWAQPDVDHAAAIMRRVVDDVDERDRRSEAAKRDLAELAAGDAGARFVIDRVRAVRRLDLRHRQRNQRAPIRPADRQHPLQHLPHEDDR